jgi:hypothetical protein
MIGGAWCALDYVFSIDVDDENLASLFRATFHSLPLAAPRDAPEQIHVVIDGSEARIRAEAEAFDCPVDQTQQAVVSFVNVRAAIRRSADLPVLHAGGVVDDDGGGVLIAGRSGSGKSTLVAAALEQGYDYLADELVAVRPDRRGEGYAKALTLKPGSWTGLRLAPPERGPDQRQFTNQVRYVPCAHFNSRAIHTSRLERVVFPHFGPGPEIIRNLEPFETLVMLCESAYQPLSTDAFERLLEVAFHASAASVSYEATADGIAALVGSARGLAPPEVTRRRGGPDDEEIAWASFSDELVLFRVSDGLTLQLSDIDRSTGELLSGPHCWSLLSDMAPDDDSA